MRIALAVLVLLLCTQSGGWAADAASAPAVTPSGVFVGHIARRSRAQDASPPVLACSPAWQKKVDLCDGQECGELYSQATQALRAEYEKFVSDLADPAPFVAAQINWVTYRDANWPGRQLRASGRSLPRRIELLADQVPCSGRMHTFRRVQRARGIHQARPVQSHPQELANGPTRKLTVANGR